MAIANLALCVLYLADFPPFLSTRPELMGLPLGMDFLLSLSVSLVVGSALEGPFLECFSSRHPLDGRGRLLQALIHTGLLGLGSWGIMLIWYPFLRPFVQSSVFGGWRETSLVAALLTPLSWQLLRAMAGRFGLRWVIRRGPFEWIPARVDWPSIHRIRWVSLSSVFWMNAVGAALLAFLILPYWLGFLFTLGRAGAGSWLGDVAPVFALVVCVMEAFAAAATAGGAVLLRRSWASRSEWVGGEVPGLVFFPRWRGILASAIPWLILWGALMPLASRIPSMIRNPRDFFASPFFWIVLSFPVGLIQAIYLGWSYGLRRETIPSAICQGFWFQALGLLELATCVTIGFIALISILDASLLIVSAGLSRFWNASPILSAISFSPATQGRFLPPDVVLLLFTVWVGRLFQMIIGTTYRRRAATNGLTATAPGDRMWGGVVFRWWRHARGNPVIRRTLGMPPHGGHRWFRLTRVGLFLGVLLLGCSVMSVGVQGVSGRGPLPFWALLGLLVGAGFPFLSGAWAALIGVLAARKARLSGEDQDLYLSLLSGEGIVGGRLAAVLGLTLLWIGVLPALTLWPFSLIRDWGEARFFLVFWTAIVVVLTVAATPGDAAVGLWFGSTRHRSGTAAFRAVLWGVALGGITFLAGGFGILLTALWLDDLIPSYLRESLSLLPATWGAAWALIPAFTRLTVGDWFGRRLARDLIGRDSS